MGIDLIEWTYDPLQALQRPPQLRQARRRRRGVRREHLRRIEQPAAPRNADRSLRRGVAPADAARRASSAAWRPAAVRDSRCAARPSSILAPGRAVVAPGPADLTSTRGGARRDPRRFLGNAGARRGARAGVAHVDARDLPDLLRAWAIERWISSWRGRRDGGSICCRESSDRGQVPRVLGPGSRLRRCGR